MARPLSLNGELFLFGLCNEIVLIGFWDLHMPAPTYTSSLTIGELEASYPTYCKALRMLVRDGITEAKAQRTVCWNRLETLHRCLPAQFRDPRQLYFLLKRDHAKAVSC
jgi:hypothetical protein